MTDIAPKVFSLTLPAAGVAFTTEVDVFEILAPATKRLWIREIKLHQISDFADAEAEILGVTLWRGHTVSGSGGAAITPVNLSAWGGAATFTAERMNTTVATTSGTLVGSEGWNVAAGVWTYPPDREKITVEAGQRFVVRVTVPNDSITAYGMMVVEERGFIA